MKNNYGKHNTGDRNTGDRNTGDENSGYWNSGDKNSGNLNSGNMNSGNMNSGNMNSGDRNTGDRNTGDENAGNLNSGDENAGDRNTGYWNSGYWNSGDYNSGDWNSGDYNSGFFNSDEPTVRMFNKDTGLKREDISLPDWLRSVEPVVWVDSKDMSPMEKKEYPEHTVNGGYLKEIGYKDAFKKAFSSAPVEEVEEMLVLPNFDFGIFEEITGISKKDFEEKLGRELA